MNRGRPASNAENEAAKARDHITSEALQPCLLKTLAASSLDPSDDMHLFYAQVAQTKKDRWDQPSYWHLSLRPCADEEQRLACDSLCISSTIKLCMLSNLVLWSQGLMPETMCSASISHENVSKWAGALWKIMLKDPSRRKRAHYYIEPCSNSGGPTRWWLPSASSARASSPPQQYGRQR
ncbi:hypothetical protein CSUI_006208 [Cystoisospora suis]|uniref:Uncharacterized protein n=1 Tax=Cystoisospora suis TaxID=483139 RepID=A0A2C6KUC9_9APIC|nr:hypothetical protein CSUI_006208 [Cystoisospora suis]